MVAARDRQEPAIAIRQASATLALHPQTLRKYERAGLLRPARRQGGARDYSPEDIERLALIKYLAAERGVNVAGMALLLELHDRLGELLQALQNEAQGPSAAAEVRIYAMLARLRGR